MTWNIVKAILPNALAVVLQLLATVIITQHVSPDLFGQWSYTYGFYSMLSPIMLMGANGLLFRELSRTKELHKHQAIVSHSVMLTLVVFAISFPVVWWHFFQTKEIDVGNPMLLSACICISSLFFGLSALLSQFYLVRKQQVLSANLFYIPKPLAVIAAALITFYIIGLDYMWLSFLVGTMIPMTLSYRRLMEFFSLVKRTFSVQMKFLRQGLIITLIYGHIQINAYIDGLYLLHVKGAEQVGQYRLAFMLASIGLFVAGSVVRQTSPHISDFLENNTTTERFRSILRRYNLLSMVLVLGALIVVLLIGKTVLVQLFGESYLIGFYPLVILLIGYLFKFIMGPCDLVLNLSYNDHILMFIVIGGISTNVLLNWLLIDNYGITGCALGTGLTTVLMALSMAFMAYKKVNVNTTVF